MKRKLLLLLFLVTTGLSLSAQQTALPQQANASRTDGDQATRWLKDGNVGFIENKGQFKDQHGKPNQAVKYLLNMPGLKVQLRQTGFSYDTYVNQAAREPAAVAAKFHRVDIELIGANPNAATTNSPAIPGQNRMIYENDEFHNLRRFESVTYHNIYPGIDLEFVARKGIDKPVEYSFIVRPGGDASRIRLKYQGAKETKLDNGHLVMQLNHGKLTENIPASWVEQTGKSVNVRYQAIAADLYAFSVPAYDRGKTLVIDPTPQVEWATYFGGAGTDRAAAIATDSQGNIYTTGYTSSTSGIATAGAFDGTYGGTSPNEDAFLAKFNSLGQLIWATYFGGAGKDLGTAVTVSGNTIYIGGVTTSPNMATAAAHQTAQTVADRNTGFLASFDATTGQRNWSTYYGGNYAFRAGRIAVDSQGNFYAYGSFKTDGMTSTANDIGTPGTFGPTKPVGGFDYNHNALAKFSAAGVRQWGTYISHGSSYLGGLSLDAADQIYISGAVSLDPQNLAANTSEGQANAGNTDGFLLKIDKANGQRAWGRYFGGADNDFLVDLHLDKVNQRIYGVGQTRSTSGISTPGTYVYQLASPPGGGGETLPFLASFDLAGSQKMGTYLLNTASLNTAASSVTQDSQGNLNIYGYTNGAGGLATNCSYNPNPIGGQDIFLNRFTSQGQRVWGTYLGTTGTDLSDVSEGSSKSIAADAQGNVILVYSSSAAGAATPGSHQPGYGGGNFDGVITKINTGALPANFAVSSSTLAPQTQTACILGIPGLITGNAVGTISPAGFYAKVFYQWQKADNSGGPWEDMPGEVFKDLQPLASQTTTYYRRVVKVNTDYCNQEAVDTSAAVSVLINSDLSPIANADGPQWYVCGPGSNTVTLNGTASGGTAAYSYQWFEGSTSYGTPLASTGTWTSPAITQSTTYTLRVTDAKGCVDIDQVTVVPAIANASVDQSVCQGAGGVQIGSTPVAGPSISYVWTRVSGDPISTLSCTTCAQPVANPSTTTVYRLTVSVTRKGGAVCTSTDDVTVTPVTAPNGILAFAGTDKTICKNTTVTLGGTEDNTFAYTWTPGQYLSASQVANPVFSAGTAAVANGAIHYTVTAIKNGCAFTDEVKVSVINSRISHQDELICGPGWIYHMDEDNAPGTVYSWSVVSGSGTVLQTANSNKDAYLKSSSGVTRFRRTATLNGVSCTADVDIQPCAGAACNFEIITLSSQECPKVFGPAGLKLGTTLGNPADFNFSWSPANLVDNAHAATVNITSTSQATITLTVTSKYDASVSCSQSILVNPPGWALPVFSVADKYTCPNTPIQIGNTPVSGFTYGWTPATGLSDPTLANPVANVAATSAFYLAIKETATGCVNRDTVTVKVSLPVAAAGNDRAVCNGATVTLGRAAPAGTNWTYAWEPTNAAWTNGTGPSDPQPQVQFAASTPQSFVLTVTDPLSHCLAKDTVVLRNTVASGEYAGAGVTTCQGTPVQLGRQAEPFAQYQWFMANGVTPATGLSSNTASNPVMLNPTATTTFAVKVSYPGCNTPMTDNITVTVNPVTVLDLPDKTVCPTGPVAIGFGAAGNPAAPGGATYLWTPASGLSDATAANPIASVTDETTYQVTVTLANGCTFTDEVKVIPSANAGSDATLCPGETTLIGTPAIPGATYTWTGAGIVGAANVARPTVAPTVTTTYSVSVTVNGCTATDQVTVNVNIPANFAIIGNTAICTGGVATLSLAGNAPANTTWQWSPLTGVANPNNTTTTINATSTQAYRLTQTNLTTGCSNYKEVIVVVNTNTISATVNDLAICEGSSANFPLNVTSSGNYSYVWSPSVGLSNTFAATPTVTTGSPRTYTVVVTDNASQCQLTKTLNVSIKAPEACFAPVTLVGNVFHDTNALKDVTVNSISAASIPAGLFVTLLDSSRTPVKTVAVNANGSFDFGVTASGDYSIVLHQTSSGSTSPSLPVGWVNTGEHLGANVGSDQAVDGILTGITVAGANVVNANFGVQQPPVTTGGNRPSQPNPGGTTTVDITSSFGLTDPDGTVETITFTRFPDNLTTIGVNGVTYVAPGATPGAGQSAWPSGNFTVPASGLSVLIDPVDGDAITSVPFFVTDNGGQESNASTVNAGFTEPVFSLSGNVYHDANGLVDNTVNANGTVAAIPTGLYVTLVDNSGSPVATVPVNSNGSYSFGNVISGTYSVVLHQTSAGSMIPSVPSGWKNTGEHLGANTGNDGTVNGILTAITVVATDVVNANFGVQQPPAADPKDYLIDKPSVDAVITLNSTHVSTGGGTSSPGQLTGNDPEDGLLSGSGKNRTVALTTLPSNGQLYYNNILVTQGQSIANYDPALLSIKLTGSGYVTTTFQYAFVDQAGIQGPQAPYTIHWQSPLPVTLIGFQANAHEKLVELTWTTSEEINSESFQIHRSQDGKVWNSIGSVKAHGESKIGKTYSFTDMQPLVGDNLYRLKMIDLDNSFAFSSIKSVYFGDLPGNSSIYPSPVNDKLSLKVVSWEQVKTVQINNLAGIQVYNSGSVQSGIIDVSSLAEGIYVLRVIHKDGSVDTHKFIHIK